MTFYTMLFADGGEEILTLSAMSTEKFRIANGGKSNKDLALEQISEKWPDRVAVKLIRTMTRETIWSENNASDNA